LGYEFCSGTISSLEASNATQKSKNKLSTMMRLLAALGIFATLESGNGAIFGGRSMPVPRRWDLGTRKQSGFGLARNLARGGAQVPYVTVEDSGEEEPVELYLPGLLEATISRTKKVS
jgi:hypothetical protein